MLFLCGDVMTGGGVDQIQAHLSQPQLYERRPLLEGYVELAEMRTGPIPWVSPAYIWGTTPVPPRLAHRWVDYIEQPLGLPGFALAGSCLSM